MSTKSPRSPGSQFNAKGVTQGTTLVGERSGLPIDEIVDTNGVRRLAVDAALTLDTVSVNIDDLEPTKDGVYIGDGSGNNLTINPDGSINSNVEVDAGDGDNIAISDGTNTLAINPDGSINVNFAASAITTPLITNIPVPSANTEQSFAFPLATKKFSIQARGTGKIKFSFSPGTSGTNYFTVFAGNSYLEESIILTSKTIYFQTNKSGETIEIISWT